MSLDGPPQVGSPRSNRNYTPFFVARTSHRNTASAVLFVVLAWTFAAVYSYVVQVYGSLQLLRVSTSTWLVFTLLFVFCLRYSSTPEFIGACLCPPTTVSIFSTSLLLWEQRGCQLVLGSIPNILRVESLRPAVSSFPLLSEESIFSSSSSTAQQDTSTTGQNRYWLCGDCGRLSCQTPHRQIECVRRAYSYNVRSSK